ncbi:MAG TPA: rhodanese-like domain-containing protein [Coriobacteriia bacterium]
MQKKLLIAILLAAVAAIAVLAVAMPAPALRENIGNDRLVALQKAGALLVDVRTNQEFAAGHIASAINVPLDQLQETAGSWSKSQPVIVYCATGARSAQAADVLAGAGFKKVYDLTAGIVAWNGAVVTGQGAPVATAPSGAVAIKTAGKPVFIEFATST